MKFSKSQRKSIMICWLILLGMFVLTLKTKVYTPVDGEMPVNYAPIAYFEVLSGNRNSLYYFISIPIIAPNILAIIYYKYYHNKFDSWIITRIGIKKYMRIINRKAFWTGFLFYLSLNIACLLCVHFLTSKFDFSYPPSNYFVMYSTNEIVNLACFVVFSSIGFALYQVCLIGVIPFIKNEFVYRAIGLINLFATLIIYFICHSLGLIKIGNLGQIPMFSCILPVNLYTPGLLFEADGIISFVFAFVFYAVLTYIMNKKRREMYEYD